MGAIVVGVDHSGESQAALEAAIEEAVIRGSSIVLVHHVHAGSSPESIGEWQRHGEALLERSQVQAAAAGLDVRVVLDIGSLSASSALLRIAEGDAATELIVIGTRRRSRVGKALMGSDAQQIIMGAEVPVLTVKDLAGRADGGGS